MGSPFICGCEEYNSKSYLHYFLDTHKHGESLTLALDLFS